jgi:hypothetical protein
MWTGAERMRREPRKKEIRSEKRNREKRKFIRILN